MTGDEAHRLRIACGAIIAVLVIIASVSAYRAYTLEKELKAFVEDVAQRFAPALLRLRGDVGLLLYHIRSNSSADTLIYVSALTRDNALAVAKAYELLYRYTHDQRYRRLSTAFRELGTAINTIMNRGPQLKQILEEKRPALEQLDGVMEELQGVKSLKDVPESVAEDISRIARELTP